MDVFRAMASICYHHQHPFHPCVIVSSEREIDRERKRVGFFLGEEQGDLSTPSLGNFRGIFEEGLPQNNDDDLTMGATKT